MDIASLFADPNLLQLESEAMINTDNAPSKRSADATAPFAPKARENRLRFSRAFDAKGEIALALLREPSAGEMGLI